MNTIEHPRPATSPPRGVLAPRLPSIGIAVAFGACVVLLTASLLVGAVEGSASATLVATLDALAVASLSAGLFAWTRAARSSRRQVVAIAPVAAAGPARSLAPSGGGPRRVAMPELSCDWFWEMDEALRFTSLQRAAPDE